MNDLSEFVNVSSKLGSDLSLVQAGGGNTSQKINSKLMAVKSSGTFLRDISLQKGFCILNYEDVKNYHDTPVDTETKYSKEINKFVQSGNGRPSMESGFHAIIPRKFVLHSHPVYLNVLLCSQEGKSILKTLYPDSLFIGTIAPGMKLSMKIKSIVNKMNDDICILFLQNHGLITASDNLESCYEIHKNISSNVKKELSLPKFILENNQDIDPILYEKSLFPDQIVFSDSGDRDSDGFKENFAAANYIFVQINSSGLTPLFLKSQLIDYIRSMDSEKYRLNLKQK